MTSGDVALACKARLARFAASHLESLDTKAAPREHTCLGDAVVLDDATSMETCTDVTLTANEETSSAYVAGWLERKCVGVVTFNDDEPLVTGEAQDFIDEVSRGALLIPHQTTFELVKLGLRFIKKARHRACCCKRLSSILIYLAEFNSIDIDCSKLYRHLATVLLSGLHNLEKDQEKNAVLHQTSLKKARLTV